MVLPPPCSISRSSNIENAKLEGACTVATTVQPSWASFFSSEQTSLAMCESRPEVGSSRKITFGRVMRASAMFTRLAWPPEMPRISWLPMTVPRHFSRRSRRMTSSTRCCFSSLVTVVGSFSSAVYISICSTVSSPSSVSNCST
mmetsp:Transcript_15167/g.39030  ORF Transcript_15167/g.39030 Transcript_15167/m.39030 type:complete len:144 (+) Transcript_15167:1359-1790(+)